MSGGNRSRRRSSSATCGTCTLVRTRCCVVKSSRRG
ncbi:hypothetical protein DSM3645_03833 [Blastopirellula marina DSM 3645]|uniref:Uncharacterized protein n=1 Tax=Blastopirellula marina DSM 3645 TaxID=314230 RepID=A3ZV78_9BACT|nr:hypothetical protein DSM3645_03833 [Blastopirellula marina DSM 3645]